MTTEKDIADFISSTVATNPRISGAALGIKVKRQFPGVIVGKLTPFIQKHCADSVVCVAQENLDYIWGPVSSATTSPDAGNTSALLPPPPPQVTSTDTSAWKAFTRHDAPAKIAINPTNAQITVIPSREATPKPLIEVPNVTPDEYRSIALDFVKNIEEKDRVRFSEIATSSLFESQWYDNIRTWRGGYYSKAWGKFRFDKLCDIFMGRLATHGLTQDLIASCVSNLKRLKSKAPKEAPSFPTLDSSPSSERPEILVQEILLRAAKSLTEEDLRRIWLPLGVVLDAIRKT